MKLKELKEHFSIAYTEEGQIRPKDLVDEKNFIIFGDLRGDLTVVKCADAGKIKRTLKDIIMDFCVSPKSWSYETANKVVLVCVDGLKKEFDVKVTLK